MTSASERCGAFRPAMFLVPAPLCSVGRHRLILRSVRDDLTLEAVQQRRFERICARELLGEVD